MDQNNPLAGMSEYQLMRLGRETLMFVRRIRDNNPELWAKIQAETRARLEREAAKG